MLAELTNFTSEGSDVLFGELHCLVSEITAPKAVKGFVIRTFMLCVASCATFQYTTKIVDFKGISFPFFLMQVAIAKPKMNCTASVKNPLAFLLYKLVRMTLYSEQRLLTM